MKCKSFSYILLRYYFQKKEVGVKITNFVSDQFILEEPFHIFAALNKKEQARN